MQATYTDNQRNAALMVLKIMLDAVKAAGSTGAPAGVMYAALCDRMTLNQFETCMGVLERKGYVRKAGHVYHWQRDL